MEMNGNNEMRERSTHGLQTVSSKENQENKQKQKQNK